MVSYVAGQQGWTGTQDAPRAEEPSGWPYARGRALAPQPAFAAPLPARPPVLPPGELDTVTGPISLSTSARRDRAAERQGGSYGYGYEGYPSHTDSAGPGHFDYSRGHGYAEGYEYPDGDGGDAVGGPYAYADDTDYTDDADYTVLEDEPLYGVPVVPVGTTFIAATPAAFSSRGIDDTGGLPSGVGREARSTGRRGSPSGGGARARGEKPEGGQRSPGAHRAPIGRPGSARAKLAIASTASLAGLSALVGSAVLATDTGPLIIPAGPGGGTSTGQFPSVQSTGSDADTSAASASSPITPGLTPQVPVVPMVPNQSDSGGQQPSDTGGGYVDAAGAYDPLVDSYDPTHDPTVDGSADSPYPTDGLSSSEIPVIPLTPRDGSATDPTTGAPAAATDQPATGSSVFNWFGIGGVPATDTPTPSPSPTDSPEQGEATPPPDATADPGTDPTATAPNAAPPNDAGQPQGTDQDPVASQQAAAADPTSTGSGTPSDTTASTSAPADPITVTDPDPAPEPDPLEDADWFTKATIGWHS
ncbi:hypothetical protein [Pseudofrankia sp. BMG5.37]|uniref:hypothetical protein n=1 Tax=Pseudofrankia sp. BMG5.37 TaxID=3050035 RepID=UPI00289489EF|nr:hypothetical protein [Pseudofrankia sp. BMG5.37]MDT3438585.1 hypothetical protein [Pseudofrankia sp. BMG5.37]